VAEILVGDRVPIRVIDVSTGGTVAGAVPRATVRFEQTGINLKGDAARDGEPPVLMEVHAERSNVKPASVTSGSRSRRSRADTNQILVNDGETAVIGGLTVTEVTVTKSGIPFLVRLADPRKAVRLQLRAGIAARSADSHHAAHYRRPW